MLHASSLRSLTVSRSRRSGTLNTAACLSVKACLWICVAKISKYRQVMRRLWGLPLFPVSKLLESGVTLDKMYSTEWARFWWAFFHGHWRSCWLCRTPQGLPSKGTPVKDLISRGANGRNLKWSPFPSADRGMRNKSFCIIICRCIYLWL